MNSGPCIRSLRPYLSRELSGVRKAAHIRFYAVARELNKAAETAKTDQSTDLKKRIEHLQKTGNLKYPRIAVDKKTLRCSDFHNRYSFLKNDEKSEELVTIRGRLVSSRVASSKLAFLDFAQDGHKVQGMLNFRRIAPEITLEQFKELVHTLHRGDIISITGNPTRTSRGELTVYATACPKLLSPSLQNLPLTLEDPETRIKNRHADMLVNRHVIDTLKLRSHIIQYIRNFFLEDKFLEVQTPMLATHASGAVARPFLTSATEVPEKALSLRIAPELWLKRLIVGGLDRVFEIGSAFRNEGVDATHNPEFTTCEFYKSFTELEELMTMTESLITGIAKHANKLIETELRGLEPVDLDFFSAPFRRVAFIPAVEQGLGQKLPDLKATDATEKVLDIFSTHSLNVPTSPTLPRLLDKLASIYIEPSCTKPTYITHHPACMTPLGKSFIDPETQQYVSARAELFIHQKELANMYEEENSPFAQRQKFIEQLKWKDEENDAVVDESYLETLQWGMPPTGGWGCGIDRLVMMFSGSKKIGDVLPFGTLRNVIGLNS